MSLDLHTRPFSQRLLALVLSYKQANNSPVNRTESVYHTQQALLLFLSILLPDRVFRGGQLVLGCLNGGRLAGVEGGIECVDSCADLFADVLERCA